MLFALPAAYLLLIYVTAALLPAIFLMRWIWRHDTVEKEPSALLASLLLRGVAAALCAIVLEKAGQRLLDAVLTPDHPYYTVALAFLVVAAVEKRVHQAELMVKVKQ